MGVSSRTHVERGARVAKWRVFHGVSGAMDAMLMKTSEITECKYALILTILRAFSISHLSCVGIFPRQATIDRFV